MSVALAVKRWWHHASLRLRGYRRVQVTLQLSRDELAALDALGDEEVFAYVGTVMLEHGVEPAVAKYTVAQFRGDPAQLRQALVDASGGPV